MVNMFSGLFNLFRGMAVLMITFYLIGIGKETIKEYLIWIFIFLWIGVIGSNIIERLKKSSG
jgi:hypothetical protein